MATSMVEWWRKQGREQGLEQGREQGLEQGREQGFEKGRAEGQRDLVLGLLKDRFGSLSEEVRRRVSAIESPEELTRLAAKAFQAHSLEDLKLA